MVALLLGVEFIDELYSGVPSVGAAEVQAAYRASYSATAWALLLAPGLVALVVEPLLFVLADRYPRKWFVCGGLFTMAGAAVVAACAPNIVVFSAAMCVAFVGSGSGVALSQATLVDARPNDRERALTQWALLGELGDLMAPLVMAVLAASSLGWRTAYLLVGAVTFVWAVLLLRHPFPASGSGVDPESAAAEDADGKVAKAQPDEEQDDDQEPGILAALSVAVRNRRLLFWLGATALCDLLDEIVVVFAALYLRDELQAGPIASAMVIGAGVAGAIAGVLVTDRLLKRVAPLRLLLGTSIACAAAYLGWMVAPTVWLSGSAFFVVGATAAPMYPIASAQAYAALPGQSGTVNAVGHVFTPIMLMAPWALGAVADSAGVSVSLGLLLIQPMGLCLVALHALRSSGSAHDGANRKR